VPANGTLAREYYLAVAPTYEAALAWRALGGLAETDR
jgi:hypothetical protein